MTKAVPIARLAAAALILIVVSAQAQTPASETPAIKIGFLADLQGSMASLGQDQVDGFMLVVDRNGGKLGGVSVHIIVEDTQAKPEMAVQAVHRLIDKEDVPIIAGIQGSNIMMAVHKAITDKGVFLVGTNAGPSQIAGGQCSPYQFIVSAQSDQAPEAMGNYAAAKGYKRVFALAPNYQGGKDIVAGFKRGFAAPLVEEVYTPLTQLDFSAELTTVAQYKLDAVFAFYPGGLGPAFVKQYQQAGLLKSLPMLSVSTVDALSLPALRDTALGLLSASFWSPDLDNAANRRFVLDFEKKYKRLPSNYAAQSYDAAMLLDGALAKVKGRVAGNKEAFRSAMVAAPFDSVRGPFKFNVNQFPLQDMHVLQVVADGAGRPSLKTIDTLARMKTDAYASQCHML
jgi:branched-chain amino acid transport system substrate-binding protein